jgi:hypothetical protein
VRIRHPWRWAGSGLIVVLLVLAAYAGWLAYDTARQLTAASDDAQQAKSDLLAGDGDGARAALDDFSTRAATAADRTGSPVWSLVTHLPVIGDDAHGVRTVSRVADDLSRTGLAQLTDALDGIDAVLPQNGAVDVAKLQSLQQPVADGDAALARARTDLAAEDPSGYVSSLRLRYEDLETTLDDAADAIAVADKVLKVLPQMMGADGPRNYLLVLQNNAEIRATGGLPGSVSLLSVDDGRISLEKQRAGGSFAELAQPVLPLTDVEKKLYTDKLGTFFNDANFTPDFPRASELWAAHWQQVEGDHIEGVLSVDTVSLSYLLAAIGPVDVDGVQLTSDNAVAELLSNVYARLPNPVDQDAFFRDVAAAIFTRVTSFSGSTDQLFTALRRAADEHRLYVHDFDNSIQSDLSGTEVAGEVSTDASTSTTPEVGIYLNDGTGGKMSYYLRYDAKVTATSCQDGVQTLSGSLTLTSTAPADARTTLPSYVTGSLLPASSAGYQLVGLRIYGPAGGTVAKFADSSVDFDQDEVDDGSRQVRETYFLIKPGQTKQLGWAVTTAPGQVGDPHVDMTPSIVAGDPDATAPSAC